MDHSPLLGCPGCKEQLDFNISMAFQPIIDMRDLTVFAYEALVRGSRGEPASDVFSHVTPENRFAFDQRCRVRAVELAAQLAIGSDERLSINFMPNAVQEPSRCLHSTQQAALRAGISFDRIIFEATEEDRLVDPARFRDIMSVYKRAGFRTAIDDFGDGFAGLSFLAEFQPDYLKLDMKLVRGIDADKPRQAIVAGIAGVANSLGATVIAEGIETPAEMRTLREIGIPIMQGYLFAKPAFEALPEVDLCRNQGNARRAPLSVRSEVLRAPRFHGRAFR
jgi:EAL domain-containing protein (putative c-di-GMP-specific phosphodiesterase class I)